MVKLFMLLFLPGRPNNVALLAFFHITMMLPSCGASPEGMNSLSQCPFFINQLSLLSLTIFPKANIKNIEAIFTNIGEWKSHAYNMPSRHVDFVLHTKGPACFIVGFCFMLKWSRRVSHFSYACGWIQPSFYLTYSWVKCKFQVRSCVHFTFVGYYFIDLARKFVLLSFPSC